MGSTGLSTGPSPSPAEPDVNDTRSIRCAFACRTLAPRQGTGSLQAGNVTIDAILEQHDNGTARLERIGLRADRA